ncbi:hypothetical protein J3R83DRAFT_2064 [Lanmaoa asiatica]|nr:hypothetical protein J3R83DRAFT_2064 [Lanmaoa asiatica]
MGHTRGSPIKHCFSSPSFSGETVIVLIYLDYFFSLSLCSTSSRVLLLVVSVVVLAPFIAARHDDQAMVKLLLVSPKGNQGVRYFPHQGYLGLTPLRFEGLVRTQIEQDGKPILAKDIIVAVRCYESRQGRLGTIQTNVLYEYSVTLWQKLDTQEWSEVGDSEYPFRFSLPSHIAAPSTALYFQEYRIFWRLEAGECITSRYLQPCSDQPSVLNHIPISAVGCRQLKHFELPLVRYDAPVSQSPPTPLTPSSSSYMTLLRSKSRGPPLRYHILTPPNPIGPLDIVSVQLIVQPLDSSVSIRSASAFVERRIHFNDVRFNPPESPPGPCRFSSYSPSNHPISSNHAQDSSSSTYPGSNSSSSQDLLQPLSSSSVYSGESSQPLLEHRECSAGVSVSIPSGGRGTTHIFAHAESAGRFSRDSSGVWRHNLTFSWPDTKSNSRWAVGESVQAGLASVRFFLRVKLIVSSLASSAETVELEDKELTIVSTNDLQRQLAFSRYGDWVNTTSARSKSKSPRRFKRDHHTEQLPSPPHSPRRAFVSEEPDTVSSLTGPPFPPAHCHRISTASSPYPGGNSSTPNVSRRPHTSAGPRDWPSALDRREFFQNQSDRFAVSQRPETTHPTRFPKYSPSSRGFFRQRSIEPPRLGSSSSVSSGGHLTVDSSQHHSHGSLLFERTNLGDVRAWEQELARIESASRRNSIDMLGFLSRRKKVGVEQPSIPTYLHAEG